MAIGNPADIGYGIGISGVGFFTQITDFSHSGWSRSSIDISSNVSTNKYRIFLPGDLVGVGTLDVEINFLTNALAAIKAAMVAAKTNVTITWPVPVDGGTTAGTLVTKAFITDFGNTAPMDDRMVGTCTVQLSDEPTVTDAA